MRCTMCENTKTLKAETKSMKYDASGLDNIVIRDVKVYHCDNCGEEYIQYGNMDEIDKAIAESLLGKSKALTGKEIRFLRTWKGYSGREFAEILKSSSAHLYRIEAKNEPVNEKFDRLVRLAIMWLTTDRDYDYRDMMLGKKKFKAFKRIELRPSKGHYKVQYA